MKFVPTRQVHLDFHTSEYIPAVAENFNAEEFAQTIADAHINSVTVFARCHHGWMYYDSKKFPERIHPTLKNKDLLVQQVRARHSRGIKAPVYLTVQADYFTAKRHGEWLIRNQDGSHTGGEFTEPGFWQRLCVNTGYLDFLKEHTAELIELFGKELDGLFFDIVGVVPCWCEHCKKEMLAKGIDIEKEAEVKEFALFMMTRFKNEMTAFVHSFDENLTVFFNSGHIGPDIKGCADAYTHFEIESLPSTWGYGDFPAVGKYAQKYGKDVLGMTGKFHNTWGDFHSLKNKAALEFEAFRALSYGFGISIGDQLEPNGRLNPATYQLIGSVYEQVQQREQWARGGKHLAEAAILNDEDCAYAQDKSCLFSAVALFDELGIQTDVVDAEMDFSPYRLLIVTDNVKGSEALSQKLNSFVKNGGKILSAGMGALCGGEYPACYGVKYLGKTALTPDFIVPEGEMARGLFEGNEYVMYDGCHIEPVTAQILMEGTSPYFNRTGEHFCSHDYTPSSKKRDHITAAVNNDSVIVFSHPVFTYYSVMAPLWCKRIVANAALRLLKTPLISHNGPSTMTVNLLEFDAMYCVHLLSYVPVRKCKKIDIIEERTVLHGVELSFHLPKQIKGATIVPENIRLELKDNKITVPEVNGYTIIKLDV